MRDRLLQYLACPLCRATLTCTAVRTAADEIEEGWLDCTGCGRRYPITGGIPRLLPPDLSQSQRRTAAAFGWQWRYFVEMHEQYRAQFLDWIHPFQPEFFRDKVVLDAGCGIGRHAYFAALFGAREVIALDLSDAVTTARRVLDGFANAHVVQGDIHRPPFRAAQSAGPFDFIYSIGVLHHLPDPRSGLDALVPLLASGGTMFSWVYGREHNRIVRHLVDPLRRWITSRMPPPAIRVIAWPLALLLHVIVKGVYRPLASSRIGQFLPMRAYLTSLSGFGFRQNYNIVFDQLVAPIAHYIRREELEDWLHGSGLAGVTLIPRNDNSWRGFGRRPDQAPAPAGR